MTNWRTLCGLLAICFLLRFSAAAATLVQWNFNSPSADAETATGSLSPARGEGTFTLVGGATSTFGVVAGGRTSDPAESDNSQLRIRSLPRIDASNKGVGVEFTIVTLGYENLTLSWDQYNSRTASRYWRVQYTRDGSTWTDHQSVANTNASTWVNFQVSFEEIGAVNDRPYLGIRLVPEFEGTALGEGAYAYTAVDPTATYTAAGSWWLDMVSINGRRIGVSNTLPTISPISDLVLEVGAAAELVPFTIGDAETAAELLEVAAFAADSAVVAAASIDGSGSEWIVRIEPGIEGQSQVTVRVTDEEGDFAETSFQVRVISEPGPTATNFFVLWNFNGATPDADSGTGSFEPALGAGAFSVIGDLTQSFGTVGQGRTSDPAASDNSMLRLSSFPRQGEGNKTAGIEFFASTMGFGDIALVWDHYNSGSASRYWRIQYTTNGTDFSEYTVFTNATASGWRRARAVSFKDVAGAGENPNFGIRMVSEFASDSGYVAVSEGSNYSTAGTLWLDMVGLIGTQIPDKPEEQQPETPPEVKIERGSNLRLSWSSSAPDYFVEAKSALDGEWVRMETVPEEREGEFRVEIDFGGAARFYRLRKNTAP